MNRFRAFLLVVLALLQPALAFAEIGVNQQSLLLLRVLAYDHNLKSRAGNTVTVAVVFRPGKPDSESRAKAIAGELEAIAERTKVSGLPVRVVTMAFVSLAAFEEKLASERPAVLYVTDGLAESIGTIAAAASRHSVVTATDNEALVRAGLGVGLIDRGNKPSLLINLPVTRAEGAEFDAAMLRLAEVSK